MEKSGGYRDRLEMESVHILLTFGVIGVGVAPAGTVMPPCEHR